MKTAEQHNEEWHCQRAPNTEYYILFAKHINWIREIQREAWDAGAEAMRKACLNHVADLLDHSTTIESIEGRP